MGVALYKIGDTHKVRGIDCEMQVFNEMSYLHNLTTGWFYSPGECYGEKKEAEKGSEKTNKEDEQKENVLNIESLKDDEVRYIAQDAKINRWHVKAITTLKLELTEMLKADSSKG